MPSGAEHEPTPEELAAVVDACYADMDIVGMGENDPGVVFGGAGEPLLRLDAIAVRLHEGEEGGTGDEGGLRYLLARGLGLVGANANGTALVLALVVAASR